VQGDEPFQLRGVVQGDEPFQLRGVVPVRSLPSLDCRAGGVGVDVGYLEPVI